MQTQQGAVAGSGHEVDLQSCVRYTLQCQAAAHLAKLTAVAALLEAAKGSGGIEDVVAVDPDGTATS